MSNDDWLSQATTVPRADTPDARTRRWTRNRWRAAIITTIALGPFAALGGIVALGAAQADVPEVPQQVTLDPPGRSDATVGVERWLAADTAPVTGVKTVTWMGADRQPDPTDREGEPLYQVWVHRFEAVTDQGTMALTLAVAYAPDIGPQIVGAPSMIPLPGPADAHLDVTATWPGIVDTTAPDPVKDAVTAWAQAYTSGDPARLRLVTGDPAAGHAYVPLAAVTLADTRLAAAGYVIGDTTQKAPVTSDSMLARVELSLTGDDGDHTQDPATIQLDLLIHDADTGAPRVVAWGGAETGTSLRPYTNATAPDRVTGTNGTSSPSPSPSSSTGTEPEVSGE